MNYAEYTNPGVAFKEYYFTASDSVSLKIIEFTPAHDKKSKPLILFVPGWISHISGWKEVLMEITQDYKTFYFETREKASSMLPSGTTVSFNMDRLVNDLDEIIEEIIPGNRKFILLGSSLGAAVILEYLSLKIRNPELSILIGPTPEFRFPKILGDIIPLLPVCTYKIIKPVIKWYLRNFRLDKKTETEQVRKYEFTLDSAHPVKLKANARALKNYSIWNKLNEINSRILIIGASSDSLHHTDNLKKLTNNLSNCKYIELTSNKETHSHVAGRLIIDFLKK